MVMFGLFLFSGFTIIAKATLSQPFQQNNPSQQQIQQSLPMQQPFQKPMQPVEQVSNFFCHQMMPEVKDKILTYEYRNSKNNARGVACIIAPDTKAAYFYLEEEMVPGSNDHIGALGYGATTADATLTGYLWRFGAGADGNSPNLPFTVNTANSGQKPWNVQISGESQIWQPRTDQGVAHWQMSAGLIPRACPSGMIQLSIIDPITRSTTDAPDREGLVCSKGQDGLSDFFAIGRRRVEGSGQLRKFVNFGRMQRAPQGLSLEGKLVNLVFLTATDSVTAQDMARLQLTFKAIPSQTGMSVLLLGDLQEKWIKPDLKGPELLKEIYLM